MPVNIEMRRDLAANWTAANPILADGEWGKETDTNKWKNGDGVTAWNALAYTIPSAGASAQPSSAQFSALSAKVELTSNAVSVVSAAVDVVSNALSVETAARIAAVNTVSNVASNAVSIANAASNAASIVSAFVAGVSAKSVGGTSTKGLQSVVNALSNRISIAGVASVTSNELSAASAQAASAINVVSARVVSASAELASLVQVASAAATSADAHANTVSARLVSASAELASLVQIASAAATSADAHANTASAAATSADAHANTVSARVVSVSAELASLVQIASAAATSADGHANTVSARVVSVSNELGSLVQIASAAATSADAHAAAASAAATSVLNVVNAVSTKSGAGSARGLQSVVNALSNRISAVIAGAASVTSTELSAASAQAKSAIDVVSIQLVSTILRLGGVSDNMTSIAVHVDNISNNLSQSIIPAISAISNNVASINFNLSAVSALKVGAVSTHGLQSVVNALSSRLAARAINTANQASITVSTGLTVSGVSVVLVAGQTYSFRFQIPFTIAAATGLMVAVVGPATNQYAAHYEIPGAAGTAGVAPAANAVTPFLAQVRAINTKVSTTSITLTGTTLMAYAEGFINPSAGGSLKFVIGPNTSGAANSGVVVLQGANLEVFRIA